MMEQPVSYDGDETPAAESAAHRAGFERQSLPPDVRVAVVGGGLAGLSAAVALSQAGGQVELFEARRRLGGRAASFRDPETGEVVDHCQHVSMGCCTNLADFCHRTGLSTFFRRDRRLHFFGPDGRRYDFSASRLLPAPAHLGPALMRLKFLALRERIGVARSLWRLYREPAREEDDETTIAAWLQQQRQSQRAIDYFWKLVLESALGDSLEHSSLRYARKVFVEGFMAQRHGYEILVPRAPLSELYGRKLEDWFAQRRVQLRLGTPVKRVLGTAEKVTGLATDAGERAFDFIIVAAPWRRVGELFDPPLRDAAGVTKAAQLTSAPITSVHLWFDHAITQLPHAVLVGKLSQWLFNRPDAEASSATAGHYFQVVISASHSLTGHAREVVIQRVCDELREVFPEARQARLLKSRVVTDPHAVFSVRPGADRLRPAQRTPVANLALAGDWTATGWPATMEGAVRSGYLAAEAAADALGRSRRFLC